MRYTFTHEGCELVGETLGYGPAVLLLHAGAEHRGVWDPVAEPLVAAGYEGSTLDLRAHGESRFAGRLAFDLLVDDVSQALQRLQRPAVVVGASLGGLLGLQCAAECAKGPGAAIAGLVLVDVVPDPDPARARAGLDQRLALQQSQWALVDDILGRADSLRAAAERTDAPTLLVRAGRSFGMRPDDTERLRGLMPQLREVVIEDCGHLVARERPAELASHLLHFLASPEVGGRLPAGRRGTELRGRSEALLARLGAGAVPHLSGTLLQHLRRTELWLDRFGASPQVRLAGLCHAAYGTDGFSTSLLPLAGRGELAAAAGDAAEGLVYRYAACDRAHFEAQLGQAQLMLRDRFTGAVAPLAAEAARDLCLLTLANELDVVLYGSVDGALRAEITALLARLEAHVPAAAG